MNERVRNVLEMMRKKTQATVDAAHEKTTATQMNQPEPRQPASYQIIFSRTTPTNTRRSNRRRLQEVMLT